MKLNTSIQKIKFSGSSKQVYFEDKKNTKIKQMTNEIKQTRYGRMKNAAKIATLGTLVLLSACSPAKKEIVESSYEPLANVNSLEFNPLAVSNFCDELIASRDLELKEPTDGRYSAIDAKKRYVLKLTEIIASLKGDDYSPNAYSAARSEYHKAVEEYFKR